MQQLFLKTLNLKYHENIIFTYQKMDFNSFIENVLF